MMDSYVLISTRTSIRQRQIRVVTDEAGLSNVLTVYCAQNRSSKLHQTSRRSKSQDKMPSPNCRFRSAHDVDRLVSRPTKCRQAVDGRKARSALGVHRAYIAEGVARFHC